MKQISAKKLYNLVIDAKADQTKRYWTTSYISEEYQEYISDSGEEHSFAGYGAASSRNVTRTREIEKTELNLAELLTCNGYKPEIYPIDFSNININAKDCVNLFDVKTFKGNEKLLAELKWCLQKQKLQLANFKEIVKKLTESQLKELYQLEIAETYKNCIYQKCQDCDPLRKTKDSIKRLLVFSTTMFLDESSPFW